MFFSFGRHLVMLLALICITTSLFSHAYTSIQAEFYVKPITCVVLKQGDKCRLLAEFSWRLPDAKAVCIWQDDTKLNCWRARMQAVERIMLELNQTSRFYLRTESEQVIAKQEIQLNTLQAKQYRRRLHSDWSLF
ncbi:DUF3019 domain-containing protein [Catenovulum maritimum]|uniref:DUF3019 domain-containing protein n=1 Tax=Catenovulum maritimum TaxID=1513271 RepID=A0A0J8JK99_9ALTE|nr:DUF3019 domain-containing protein [Catenovulum maritimum]KMT64896.1 hypothetical protein XM47_11845 [Catenovulum maritimum]